MKNQSITALSKKHVFTRNNNGEFFQEKFYFRLSRDNYDTNLLNNRTFGESTFFPGGKFNMGSQYWVFQIQLTGNPTVSYNNIKKTLTPGDMLIIPPRTKYTYIAGEKTMTKYFITMQNSPLLDLLLLNEVEKHGIVLRKRSNEDYTDIFSQIRDTMLSGDTENTSVLLYKLIYRLRKTFSASPQQGNFRQKLKNAVSKIEFMTSLDALAAEFNMPKYTLIRTFRKELNTTPIEYMISMRLEHAKQLLSFSELSINEISCSSGYNSPAFFSSEFRKKFGMTPSAYREKYFTGQK